MEKLLVVFFCLITPLIAAAGDKGYRIAYEGGSLPGLKAGTSLKIHFELNQLRLVKDKDDFATIPASAITEICYGHSVCRRVSKAVAEGSFAGGTGTPTTLNNPKRQFVGITWAKGDQRGGMAVQCDENDCRSILAALADITGLRAVNSDVMTAKNQPALNASR